jgi:3-methyladenine DNA glycosylase/8-oxoguanine DNA glycosylase
MAAPDLLAVGPRADGLSFDPDAACRHLGEGDPVMGGLIARVGQFTMRPEPAHSLFQVLARSIAHQQLTGKAAATILARVTRLFAPKRFPTPRDLIEISPERLRGAGLSTAKTAALRDLAARTLDGTVPSLSRVRRMEDEEIIARLTAVRGIGRWTVEMLLIFKLGRPDVLPLGDLGIRKGFAQTFGKRKLPDAAAMSRRGERWRPFRSVASWYLWRALEL